MRVSPAKISRQIGDYKWKFSINLHIQNNYPNLTIVSAHHKGYIYTVETHNDNPSDNIWLKTYNINFDQLNIDINSTNFNNDICYLINNNIILPQTYYQYQ